MQRHAATIPVKKGRTLSEIVRIPGRDTVIRMTQGTYGFAAEMVLRPDRTVEGRWTDGVELDEGAGDGVAGRGTTNHATSSNAEKSSSNCGSVHLCYTRILNAVRSVSADAADEIEQLRTDASAAEAAKAIEDLIKLGAQRDAE